MDLFWTIWLICGVISAGITNNYFRHHFYSLYIENYYDFDVGNIFRISDILLIILMILCGFGGLISVAMILLAKKFNKQPTHFGWSFRISRWSEEEAKILFPDKYKWKIDPNKYSWE